MPTVAEPEAQFPFVIFHLPFVIGFNSGTERLLARKSASWALATRKQAARVNTRTIKRRSYFSFFIIISNQRVFCTRERDPCTATIALKPTIGASAEVLSTPEDYFTSSTKRRYSDST